MNKLELVTAVLNADLKDADMTEDQRKFKISDALKTFAADMLNLHAMLQEKKLEPEAVRELMEQQGLEYSGKSRKFS